jgi:hypothetical protein
MRLGSVFILRAPTDEASLTLSIAVLGMFLNRVVGSIISKPWKLLWGVVGTAFCFIGIVLLLASVDHLTGHRYHPPAFLIELIGWGMAPALWLEAIGPALIAAYLFLPAVLGVAALAMLGYNFREAIILTFRTEAHVEVTPAKGPWPVFCPSERMNCLHHKVYISKEVQGELLLWLKANQGQVNADNNNSQVRRTACLWK